MGYVASLSVHTASNGRAHCSRSTLPLAALVALSADWPALWTEQTRSPSLGQQEEGSPHLGGSLGFRIGSPGTALPPPGLGALQAQQPPLLLPVTCGGIVVSLGRGTPVLSLAGHLLGVDYLRIIFLAVEQTRREMAFAGD